MRLLLDECLPRKVKRHLPGHQVRTVADMGWSGKKNGELLGLADGLFDAFITIDQNIPAQQNVGARSFAILVLGAKSNRLQDLLPIVPDILQSLTTASPGCFVNVESDQ